MIEVILWHTVLSAVLLISGIILYFTLNYLFEIPEKGKLSRLYESTGDKEKRRGKKRKATKIFMAVLVWMVIAINIVFYYI